MAEGLNKEIKKLLPSFVKAITTSADNYRVAIEAGFKPYFVGEISLAYQQAIEYVLSTRKFSAAVVESFLLQSGVRDVLEDFRNAQVMNTDAIADFVKVLLNYYIQVKLHYFKERMSSMSSSTAVLDLRERVRGFYDEFNKFIVSTLAGVFNEGVYYSTDFVKYGVSTLEEDLQSSSVFYTTGLPALDSKLIEGFAPGKLTILAGRPGAGKSIVVTNIFTNLIQYGTHVLFFNNEMDAKSIFRRIVSIIGSVDFHYLTKDVVALKNDSVLLDQVKTAVKKLKEHEHFVVVDKTDLSLADIYIEVYNYKEKFNPKHLVVIVDLVNRLSDVRRDFANRAAVYEDVAYELKSLARNLDVHVVACAQLRRKSQHSTRRGLSGLAGLRPTMDEVKNSGGFEEAADLLLLLFRPKLYVSLSDLGKDFLEIHVGKQRQGLIDSLPAVFEVMPNVPRLVSSELTPDLREDALDDFNVDEVF